MRKTLNKIFTPKTRRIAFWGAAVLNLAIISMFGAVWYDTYRKSEEARFQQALAANLADLDAYFMVSNTKKPLPIMSSTASSLDQMACLAEALFYESDPFNSVDSRGNAHVMFNRVGSELYPNTLCEVIQEKSAKGTWQFSYNAFQRDAKSSYAKAGKNWEFAKEMAARIFTEEAFGRFHETEALLYHAEWMKKEPYWVPVDMANCRMKLLGRIGAHIHYGLNDPSEKALCIAERKGRKTDVQVAQAPRNVPVPTPRPAHKGKKVTAPTEAKPQAQPAALAFIPVPKQRPATDAIAALIAAQ